MALCCAQNHENWGILYWRAASLFYCVGMMPFVTRFACFRHGFDLKKLHWPAGVKMALYRSLAGC